MMRRRTKKMGSKRQMVYLVVIAIILTVNYIYDNHIAPHKEQLQAAIEAPTENAPAPSKQPPIEKASEQQSQHKKQEQPQASTHARTHRSGWAELPAQSDNADHYTAYHTSEGIRNYSVCFSRKHCSPVWVAAPMHSCYKGEAKRSNSYSFDPKLPIEIQPMLKRSYGDYTRGHILASAERTITQEMNKQLFYVTNIAPQIREGFNASGGAWNNLESFADKQVCADTLYVVTGVLFDDYTDPSGHTVKASTTTNKNDDKQVAVPTAFYKVLLRTKSGSSGKSVLDCSAEELKCAAFIVGHYSSSRRTSKSNMISVKELERMTGIEFFAGVKSAPKQRAVAEEWGL